MTNFKKQIVSVVFVGAMFLNLAAPALATEIVITGNGAGSDNYTTVTQNSTTTVDQNNDAHVDNDVNADADTGDNDANFNTGGDVVVSTGKAKVDTDIQNSLNSNHAEVDCCEQDGADVEISGNGAFTDNDVELNNRTKTNVTQDNYANVDNDVDADADTGDNDAYKNTGGDVTIVTGNATADTSISTHANVNSARVGNENAGAENPSARFVISGNGAGSDNYITAALAKNTTVDQDNDAHVDNDVDADADTGDNDANFNTGGDVLIGTGHATVDAVVDNAVNFNHADVDCGCTWDVLAKISGNGADFGHGFSEDGDNTIALTLNSTQRALQDNYANLDNDLEDLDADTGENDAESNTGEAESDPAIVTGNAVVESGVSNSGNVNTVGDMDFDWPEVPEVDVSFNLSALWAFFGLSA